MKNILVFITHATLGLEHADLCIEHLGKSVDPLVFDKMIVYNTHQHELSNEKITELITKHKILDRICKEISLFDYNESTPKTLGHDCINIFNFLLNNYSMTDRVLILKSDIMISVNLLSELRDIQSSLKQTFILTPPFITAKERVSNDEIREYCSRTSIVLSDEKTFFDEDCNGGETDHGKRNPLDKDIKFISCTGKIDFSCHYMSLDLSLVMTVHSKTWGGVNFESCRDFWVGTEKSFTVHKYHSIVSENRVGEREGPIERYFKS
ncbi:MAG: hypothetical protein PHG66_04320 [Candidatus Colwellbacteria bacterium]|nr:hypothetical protein [Candidatus Colwellbacteria bacterium]